MRTPVETIDGEYLGDVDVRGTDVKSCWFDLGKAQFAFHWAWIAIEDRKIYQLSGGLAPYDESVG
jgi:hypothetical protein